MTSNSSVCPTPLSSCPLLVRSRWIYFIQVPIVAVFPFHRTKPTLSAHYSTKAPFLVKLVAYEPRKTGRETSEASKGEYGKGPRDTDRIRRRDHFFGFLFERRDPKTETYLSEMTALQPLKRWGLCVVSLSPKLTWKFRFALLCQMVVVGGIQQPVGVERDGVEVSRVGL